MLLAHPGGPYWAKKDDGAWSIPKGEIADDEEPLAAARREFEEEMGHPADGEFLPLEPLKQPSGKLVIAWAVCCDFDPSTLESNTFSMEWPPKSGLQAQFPEVDRARVVSDRRREAENPERAGAVPRSAAREGAVHGTGHASGRAARGSAPHGSPAIPLRRELMRSPGAAVRIRRGGGALCPGAADVSAGARGRHHP